MPQLTTLVNTLVSILLQILIHVFSGIYLTPQTSFFAHNPQSITLKGALISILTLETFFFANMPQLTIPTSVSISVLLQVLIYTSPDIFLTLKTFFSTDTSEPITLTVVLISIQTLETGFFANVTQSTTLTSVLACFLPKILYQTSSGVFLGIILVILRVISVLNNLPLNKILLQIVFLNVSQKQSLIYKERACNSYIVIIKFS